ncbi:polycomb group protein EMBRYONIC FLOWER 2-like isoform X2 [Andrographis paniculata]|uniref:polycomb group protein EMBRYONIC FLOWER 2-like isoform X2 n=1 Tax=Andrographis paniculata TaxID=175694 RepID=UPI0021E6E2B4|nr:polycomb group protein EMBRYONIC FLOWER 2-like isoform X2 [Andrographis paniculata]
MNCVCNCGYSQDADHVCSHDPQSNLSAEEKLAADESFSHYCKPVELYNILQRRAVKSPSFLQRCLQYKVEAKHKKRIQMAISLPSTVNDESQIQNLFPLCILVARQVSSPSVVEDSSIYHFSRECLLTKCTGSDRVNQDVANFILPEINKLSAEVKSGFLSILFVSCAELFKDNEDGSLFQANVGGHCYLGKIPMELLQISWEKSLNLSSGERAEMLSTVDLHSCYLKTSCFGEDKCFSFCSPRPHAGAMAMSLQLQVCIAAEEIGAKDRSPYDSLSYRGIHSSVSPQIIRLRAGNVVFNYKYYNNRLQSTEVTEDFSCPFCLFKCGSFKGLRYHLPSFHDLFNFEFWVTEELQAVNVSIKTDTWRSENVAAGVDPKQQTFFFCSKAGKRRRPKSLVKSTKHAHALVFDSEIPEPLNELRKKTDESGDRDISSPKVSSATTHSYADPECVQSLTGSNLKAPALLRFARKKKLPVERSDSRNHSLLHKREFFHSKRAQPMAMEQVLSDHDSEDEVDNDVADIEDRTMLDDFVDVSKDEKQLMYLWNSFVRRQRVLADAHIPWTCEAFSKLHGKDFVKAPGLLCCWRLFMIKLWNHGLLDARTMNNCNIILEKCEGQGTSDNHQPPSGQ